MNASPMSANIAALRCQLGRRVFALRKAAGMTQFKLAEAVGVGNEYAALYRETHAEREMAWAECTTSKR